jgi:AAHS family 4-hydroxybenzoate transporter-like MFS transporter
MPSGSVFDVSAALDRRKIGSFEIQLIVLSWFVTFFDGFDMNVIAFTSNYLIRDFHLTDPMLGNVFSAGIVGTLVGGFLFGYVGDRIGRRPAILLAVGSFSVLTLAIAFARNYEALLVLRFLDGLALGGVLPLIWALNAEYAPVRSRATVNTIIMLGYGVGVAAAGPLARLVLPHFDWPGVFVLGAALSFAATVVLWVGLPESMRFLAARGDRPRAVEKLLRRMKIALPSDGSELRFVMSDETTPQGERFRFSSLFAGYLKWLTPLLWVSYFASSISTFFLASWGPKILEDMGFSADHAAYVTSFNSIFAATGGLALMRFTDKHGPVSIAVLPLTAVPLLLLAGLAPLNLLAFLIVLVPLSVFLGGSHYGVVSIISSFYPSAIRANGSGWCSGVGKIGSVIGPLVGGYVLATGLPVRMSYALLAICPLVYGLAVLGVGMIVRGERLHEAEAEPQPVAAVAE